MAKNGKGFEKFLREQTAPVSSPETNDEKQRRTAQALIDAIMQKKSPEEIERIGAEARAATDAVSQDIQKQKDKEKLNQRISPAYWVTQNDYIAAFGRPYDAMSKEDQRNFFELVRNAPNAQRRTDVPGASANEVVPTRQRPEYIPTFQDVDGVKVPESAFGKLEKTETGYDVVPQYPEPERKAARAAGFRDTPSYREQKAKVEKVKAASEEMQRDVDKNIEIRKQAQVDALLTPLRPWLSPIRQKTAPELEPAPAPDPEPAPAAPSAVGPSTFPGVPARLAGIIATLPYTFPQESKPASAPPPEPAPAPDPEPLPADVVAGVDVEGPPKSEKERSRMMLDAMYADQQKAKKQGPRGTSLKAVDPSKGYWVFDQTTEKWLFVDSKKDKSDSPQRQTVATPAPTKPSAKSSSVPAQVAAAMTPQPKPLPNFGQISPEIASRMVSAQTPGKISTSLTGRDLTTQDSDRFKFDSALPASVAAAMDRVSPVRTPLSQEPLTQTKKPMAGGKKGEREMASFTKGMSDAEVSAEFEKIFGKENKNLSIEMKKDMIERFRLGELMQEGGGIMGINPMYEIEIDPDTGELKLNPKKSN